MIDITTEIAGCQITEKIYAGSRTLVYKGIDLQNSASVVIKLIDSLIIEKIASHAKKNNMSANSWLEDYLFNSLKAMGIIDTNEPPLGETRGGDRKSKEIG